MVDMISASNTFKNAMFLFAPAWRNQNRDRTADRFFGRIAKHSLCALVPTSNSAIKSLAYDGVIAGLDNGSEPPTTFLAFSQGCFDLASFNKVRGLASKHIQRPKLTFCGLVRLAPVGRNHAEQPAGPRD